MLSEFFLLCCCPSRASVVLIMPSGTGLSIHRCVTGAWIDSHTVSVCLRAGAFYRRNTEQIYIEVVADFPTYLPWVYKKVIRCVYLKSQSFFVNILSLYIYIYITKLNKKIINKSLNLFLLSLFMYHMKTNCSL